MSIFATDTVLLGDVHVHDAGYLEGFVRTARTGVQQYLGSEMGRPDLGVVNVYRDAGEVFSKASLHSFSKLPVTIDHPPAGVSARNWKQVAVGTTGDEVLRDGESLKIGLKILDAAAVQAVRDGKRQLSVGYKTEIVWGDGTTPDGTPYQARQTGIVADHIAIVSAGRAGPEYRFGDSWASFNTGDATPVGDGLAPPQPRTPSMKTLTIDGHAVELSDAALIAVSNLQKQVATTAADNLQLTADAKVAADAHKKAVEAKDGEILKLQADYKVATDAKDAEIATLKAQAVTADKLDAAIAERAAVLDAAKPTLGASFDAKGKSVADIRRATVAKRLGDKAVEGKTDEHVAIAFDTLTTAGVGHADPIRHVMGDGVGKPAGDAAGAYAAMMADMGNAYLPPKSA